MFVGAVCCAQRMFNARNRRHLPQCIRRLFGLDNAVENMSYEELLRQARKPKATKPKAQLMKALSPTKLPRFCAALSCHVSVDAVSAQEPDAGVAM
jgi:hypothetical protein